MKRTLLIVAIATLPMLFTACQGGETASKKDTLVNTDSKKEIVAVERAKKLAFDHTITYNGNIEPYKKNNIASAMPVRIDDIFVEVGDMVTKGETVAEMDKNQLIQQQLQLNNLAVELWRLKGLYESGGISKQQLDQLQLQHDVAEKAFNYLRDNSTLLSPINGVVTARYYDKGDMFSATPSTSGAAAVVTVMQIDTLKVRVNISEEYFTKIKLGMPVEITSESYPNEIFKGDITLIYPLIDAATRSFTAEVTIPNKELELRPGMFITVGINIGTTEAISVADVAVQKQIGSNERYVFVVNNGIATRKVVTIGDIRGNSTEILSGLNIGDMVVTKGAKRLNDGQKVEITK